MKKLLGSMKKPRGDDSRSNGYRNSVVVPTGDGPDAVVYREVAAFCESGAPGSNTTGDEYLHLPAIVDAAESSPSAANQAAIRIRGYLGKDHYDRGFAQYNAIMLTRILTDNPGRVFTQNFDKDFVATVKKLLRDGKDTSVQQILRETLDYFEVKSRENDSLMPLMEMWAKEKGSGARIVYPRSSVNRAPPMPPRPRGLPAPDELAARIEEAKTTARLLVQTVQSTPSNELLQNDLVKEFAERCRSASKSIQAYMNAENPHPDDDTMLTLIETNEQLNVAMSKHQRSVLQARKAMGGATPSPQPQEQRTQYMTGGENVYGQPPPMQPQRPQQQPVLSPPIVNGQGRTSPRNDQFMPPAGPPPGRPTNNVYSEYQTQPQTTYKTPTTTTNYEVAENPFQDTNTYEQPQQQNYSLFGRDSNQQRPLQQQRQQHEPPVSANAYGPLGDNPYSPPESNSYAQPIPNRYSQQYSQPAANQYPQSAPRQFSQPPSDQYPQPLATRQSPNASNRYSRASPTEYAQPEAPPQRPGAYNQGFTATPSYIHRQDSAAAHLTMHGASPPSESQR